MNGRPWTPLERKLAKDWFAAKVPLSEIALALDRSLYAVKEKVFRAERYKNGIRHVVETLRPEPEKPKTPDALTLDLPKNRVTIRSPYQRPQWFIRP